MGMRVRSKDTYQMKGYSQDNYYIIMGERIFSSFYEPQENDWDYEAYEVYEEYVEDQYLQIPVGQLSRLQNDVETAGRNFTEKCRYSFDLSPVPADWDIVEYFLFEQQKGYCMHFASAYTLMNRIYGIPMRYVSGYLVQPGDFHENEDGTYTAQVTGQRAHAWVEYYETARGWLPAETTPGDYLSALDYAEPGTSVETVVKELEERYRKQHGVQPGQQPAPNPTPPADQNPTPPAQQNPTTDNPSSYPKGGKGVGIVGRWYGIAEENPLLGVLLIVFVVGLILAALTGILILRIKVIRNRRLQRFTFQDSRQAAEAILKETIRLLAIVNLPLKETDHELRYGQEVEASLPCFKEKEFVAFIEIARILRYSKKDITQGQQKYMYMIYRKLRAHVVSELKWYEKPWLLYIWPVI